MDQTNRNREHHEHTLQGQDVVQLHKATQGEHHEREPVGHEHEHAHQVEPTEHHAQERAQRVSRGLGVTVYIDGNPYTAPTAHITGAEVRQLARPSISADKDVFHTVPGTNVAVKMADADFVDVNPRGVTHGRHFYSAAKTSAAQTEDLAKRAYFMYLNQGRKNGHDVQHWLAAEKQLASRAKS
jgi:hypothetical protein